MGLQACKYKRESIQELFSYEFNTSHLPTKKFLAADHDP